MILLLLTSALALSFVPLKSNDPTTTVTVEGVAFTPSTKLTVTIKSTDDVSTTATGTYRVAIYESADATEHLFEQSFDKALLDNKDQEVEVTVDMAQIPAGLEKLHIGVLEKIGEAAEEAMITPRHEVAFRTVSAVAFAEDTDPTKVKITVTVDDEVTGATLEFLGESLETTSTVAKEYSAAIEKEKILAADSLVGYFKGADLAKSSLPFTILIAKPVAPAFKLLSATHVQFDYTPTVGAKLMILPTGDTEKEITKPQGKDYYTVAYADISVGYKLYYAKAAGVPMSAAHAGTALPATVGPTAKDLVAVTGADKVPSLKLTFAAEVTNRQLVVVDEELAVNSVALAEQTLTAEKLVGSAAFFIVADSTTKVVASLPLALEKAVFAQTPAESGENIVVTVVMTAGYYKAKPAGLIVHSKGESDIAKAEYYAFTWSDTTASTATASVTVSKLPESTRKDVESYVCPDYATKPAKMDDVVRLSTAKVLREATLPTVTVGTLTFVPAGLKLTVPLKSSEDLSEDVGINYAVAIYATAEGGDVPLGGADIKALLVGTDKSIVVELDSAEYADQKTLYVDIVQAEGDEAPVSIIDPVGRKPVAFAAKTAIAVEKIETDLKFTITLDSDLATPLTDVKFVFNNVPKDVAAVTGETKKFTVTIPLADVRDAESKLGYVKGKDLATSTLPFSVVPPTPAPVLGLLSATHAKCVLADAPEGMKVMLKSGTADAKEMTKEDDEDFFRIAYADLKAVCKVYYAIGADKFGEEATITALAALVAPSGEALVAVADKLPSLKVTFGAAVDNRQLVLVQKEGVPIVVPVNELETTITSDKLVGTAGYYIVTDEAGKVPKSEGKALAAATFTQTKAAAAEGKIPVTVEMTKGFYAAEPKGLLVHAKGEEDKTKMKFYALTWDAETAKEAKADVIVEDFKTITDKDIESYVCPDYSEAIPDEPVKISEAFVVIAKTEPVEPEPKDEGAFGQMVSLMAVVVSLFVLTL